MQERLSSWGRCIRTQRLRQRITAAELCTRIGISEATLRRLEQGDPGVGTGIYLTALLTLGVVDDAAPPLPPPLWSDLPQRRVRLSRQERGGEDDADYF
ncbi:helix-turn-helix domain-containing protein [Noviherbaspirillum aerium]|uniref:helix-turn-helix domain-containing protein n=1 Tax=Noviherbaspirillum aerium TaxID=2588497 RepID=UPI00178C7F2A|nr:helix-turn-helix transcriptional regulator [Noviherbaspirillum aerium]